MIVVRLNVYSKIGVALNNRKVEEEVRIVVDNTVVIRLYFLDLVEDKIF